MIRLFKPEYFAPYHGEYRMLKEHCDVATLCGVPKEKTFILGNGDVLNMENGNVFQSGKVIANDVYVDGNRIGDIGSAVIKDRKLMSDNGILAIIMNVNTENMELLSRPIITTRGFIVVNENEELIKDIERKVTEIINAEFKKKNYNYNDFKANLIGGIALYLNEKTGRTPIILPIVMDIKTTSV